MASKNPSSPTKAPASPSSSGASHASASRVRRNHTTQTLKADLQKVSAARGNVHTTRLAFLCRFSGDDTGAADDVTTMAKLMGDDFNFQVEQHVVRKNTMIPLGPLLNACSKFVETHHNAGQTSLLVFYYAGHGKAVDGKLVLSSGNSRLEWAAIASSIFNNNSDHMKGLDVLTIMDSCFSGLATRSQSIRTIQVLSACGPSDETRARASGISFTQRIHRSVHALKHAPISIPALFEHLSQNKRKSVPQPQLVTISGTAPIVLIHKSLGLHNTMPSLPQSVKSKINVLVKLVLDGQPTDMYALFKEAIKDLPYQLHVEVSIVYETDQSVGFILRMSWETMAWWGMVADLDFVMVTVGDSLMPKPFSLQSRAENITYRQGGPAKQ
ncbi:hypothetical protein N7462_009383 [Penicillium macrosclerotiorum]|uniref:uncharacterized protein n=1 Tax=Penicillium macrosclerotiorum TaxID=303699 RepID=UPI00254803A6|nr:uncharacterized protein N7462_009383 [Penicillium macrosclerotiorum]KAJ5673944.1 hypothetical protein N7462_009383 [Penicillium macrosclerotiorum]